LPASDEHRALAGRWLAAVHRAPGSADLRSVLPDRGPDYYLQLLHSTQAGLLKRVNNPTLYADDVALLRRLVAQCDVIQAHWEELAQCFEGCPHGLVHGDFVIKNLRIRNGAGRPALLVFDWEMAGWGVPATDLAQFVGKTVS